MGFFLMSSPALATVPTYYSAAPTINHAPTSKNPPYITIIKAWRHGETRANRENKLSGGGPDSLLTALNDEGRQQAEKLGNLVVQNGVLDVIYTSDLGRALDTAGAVLKAFERDGVIIEQRISKQLREILHGQFELSDGKARNESGSARFREALAADEQQQTPEKELKDKYRFWKIHPLVSNAEVVPEDIVNVEDYIQRGETRPETPYQLWQRVHQEFIRIAKENPGRTVGISMHGAGLATLLDGLNKNPKGVYLPPHYNSKEIKIDDQVIIPAAAKVENCALIYFKYDSRNGGKLELYDPQTTQELAPKTQNLADLSELPTSDEAVQRTYLIRHGESTANVYFEVDGKKVRYVSGQSTEVPLTDLGRQQITALAENLSRCFPKHAKLVLVSSTAQRTQQTARIIFEELSKTHPNLILANEVYEGLNERHLGAWEGLLRDENYMKAEAPWKKLSAAEKFIFPEVSGGESYSQVASRALPALSEIYNKYTGATVLAVTSFNTINATAIQISDALINLPTEPETNLPKLNLGNGDLVLFEAETEHGFASTNALSHIKHTKSE